MLWKRRPLALVAVLVVACSETGEPDAPVSTDAPRGSPPSITEGVRGRITDTDGRPVSGARIQPVSLDEDSPPIPEIAILSKDDGTYAWPLREGSYELVVTREGYQRARGRVTVEAGEVATLDVTLVREDDP